uniref:Solute carrier family 22 member 6-B-like n=1 Tax=Pogona vitticeps TaxID=103695 RepID=A0ABM5F380_9SAUR
MPPAQGQHDATLCAESPAPPLSFGDLLEKVGSMGPFQLFSVILVSLPVLLLASHNLVQNFSAATPEHQCRLLPPPSNASQNGHLLQPLHQNIQPDSCQRVVLHWSLDPNRSLDREMETKPCLDGWQYDNSTFISTIVTEWDLVCKLKPLKTLAQSLYMAGVVVGAFVLGDLSDRFGRRLILIWSLLLVAVTGTGAACSDSFATYCALRFLSGVGISGFLMNHVCLGLEWVPTKHRATVVSAQSYCATAGQVVLAGLAYGMRSWRWLQLAISAPFFCFFAYSWCLSESPRWLLVNNKREAALRNLKLMARVNGRKAAGEAMALEMLEIQRGSSSPGAHSCLDLFRTPGLRSITVCLMLISFSINMAFFGLSMDLSVFGLNVFLVQLFFGATDLVAKMGCALMLTLLGRRTLQAASLLFAGILLLVSLPVPSDMLTARLVLVVLGKGGLAASSMCLSLYGGELFPTVIRQTGISFITMMARLGGLVAPLILMTGDSHPFLPLVIFGATPIISGISALFLPETLDTPLPDTVEQVEDRARWKSRAVLGEMPEEIATHVVQSTHF